MGIMKGDGTARVIWGRVIIDPEMSVFGNNNYPKTRFTVAVSSDKNDKNGLLSCNALFETAKGCRQLKKGDQVLIGGMLESYDGRDGAKRYSLLVEFCAKSLTAVECEAQTELAGFEDITDSDLPF